MDTENPVDKDRETLIWALRRALDWLDAANRGESLVEVEAGIAEVHKILSDNGMTYNDKGQLIYVAKGWKGLEV